MMTALAAAKAYAAAGQTTSATSGLAGAAEGGMDFGALVKNDTHRAVKDHGLTR